MGDGKTSRLYRKQRLAFKAQGQADDEPCWICGMGIDYRLDHTDPQGWQLDHMYPRSTHPEHAEDPANYRHSHSACNNRRGNKMIDADLGRLSRKWLKD